jgi:hypothetical protein
MFLIRFENPRPLGVVRDLRLCLSGFFEIAAAKQ